MKLIKTNFHDITKLFINQIGITIFSLLLYTSLGVVSGNDLLVNLKLFISLFAIIFYFCLIYCAAWDLGANDKIKIDSGKIENTPIKGLALSLYANILNFLLAVIAIISMTVHTVSSSDAAYSVFAICNLFLRFLCAMYLGFIQSVLNFGDVNTSFLIQSIGFLGCIAISVLVTHFGYTMGLKEKRLFGKLFAKGAKLR